MAAADPLSSLKPEHRAMVEFYANPANSMTYKDEVRAAQAAGLEKLSPQQIRNLFCRKKVQAAIVAYAETHGIAAPATTADDAESVRQDALLDEMIGLNILDVMEEVQIARVDDLGNLYYERHLQMRPLEEIKHLGKYAKGLKIDPKKNGQKLELEFHDKLSAKRLRDTIKKRIGEHGGSGIAPVVNIFIPSLGGQHARPIKVVSPEEEGGADAEA